MGQPAAWQGDRFLLWIDGGGGYLVCLKQMVVLGHVGAGGNVDVPILAPIAAEHVRLWREEEGYWIDPLEAVWMDAEPLKEASWVRDGAQIQLGSSFCFRFCLPHPYSLSARLEFLSSHRTEPRTDGVLLMGQSCLLGAQASCHIVCPWLEKPVVLFQHQGGLYCRSEGVLEWDGQCYENQAGPLGPYSRLRTEGLSLALEAF